MAKVRQCGMETCTFNREIEIDTSRRTMTEAVHLTDRLDIEGRCVYCSFFDGFDLLMQKEGKLNGQ